VSASSPAEHGARLCSLAALALAFVSLALSSSTLGGAWPDRLALALGLVALPLAAWGGLTPPRRAFRTAALLFALTVAALQLALRLSR